MEIYDLINVEGDSVLEAFINKYEKEIKLAIEFEKIISNEKLYYGIKALSLKEKMVLFYLYNENREINKIALEMHCDRSRFCKKIKCFNKMY